MSRKWFKVKLTGIFFVFCIIAVIGRSSHAEAAEKLNLNQSYTIKLEEDNDSELYQFTVPSAGNICVQIRNTDPAGEQEIWAQMYDSNNLEITERWSGAGVTMPVYSSDKNRTYYLKVGNGWHAYETSYNLTVEFEATTDWETEENNSTKSADMIKAGSKWYGMINDKNDDCDYFRFTLSANKKVNIQFGPAVVDGADHTWKVSLLDSKNNSVEIYDDSVIKTYNCYLKKGTYYIKVESRLHSQNVTYALSYSESAVKLNSVSITSVKPSGYSYVFGGGHCVKLDAINIKNSGDATGYTVRVAKKKSMKGKLAAEDIDFGDKATKKKVALDKTLDVMRNYYVQVRSYVKDPFGGIVYGKYSKVKTVRLSNSLYKKLQG